LKKIRVGFIGAGKMANRVHYPSLAEIEEVEMIAICDLDEKRLNDTANKYGIKYRFVSYEKMFSKVDIDAVYVIMPPMSLSKVVIDCLNAGKAVFMEKPPGVNLEDTRRMLEVAKRKNIKTMVGFNRRFCPIVLEAKRIVEKEGPLSQCLVEFHKNMLTTEPYYNMNMLYTDIIHVVDLLHWWGGKPKEIYSLVDQFYVTWDNSFNVLIRFENQMVGVLTANRASGSRYERFELHGKGISAYIRAPEIAKIYKDGEKDPQVLNGLDLTGTNDMRITYGYLQENEHFIECLIQNRTPLTSLEDSVKTMELVEMILNKRT